MRSQNVLITIVKSITFIIEKLGVKLRNGLVLLLLYVFPLECKPDIN